MGEGCASGSNCLQWNRQATSDHLHFSWDGQEKGTCAAVLLFLEAKLAFIFARES